MLFVKQLYTACLAEAAYYIQCNREAAIIDPLREVEPYLQLAQERGATIKYIFETHFHADFVSGHLDLARKTGATIIFGPNARPAYAAYIATDKEMFHLGDARIKVLHTPGHTLESTCYLLIDEDSKDHAVFTGDTLFNGDVGRPDLVVSSDCTEEALAGLLFESLKRLKDLDDRVIVYPAHGAGSQCGKNMKSETFTTIGEQKRYNYAMLALDKGEFIQAVTCGLSKPPVYFTDTARINMTGYESIEEVMKRNLKALSVEDFILEIENGARVLDTRHPDAFEKGFIQDSINIGLNGQYAVWAGNLFKIHQPLVLVTEAGSEKESILRLARVGFENVKGYLNGGIEVWQQTGRYLQKISSVHAQEVKYLEEEGYQVLDVRNNTEHELEHMAGAINIPLMDLVERLNELRKDGKYLIHCAGGYRSMIASSMLKQQGYEQIKNVHGGFHAMKEHVRTKTSSIPTAEK